MPSADFQAAVEASRKLKAKPSDTELLELYALFKQANGESFEAATKPGSFDFKGKYKYNAWKKVVDEGVTPAQAEKKYVTLVGSLKEKYGYEG